MHSTDYSPRVGVSMGLGGVGVEMGTAGPNYSPMSSTTASLEPTLLLCNCKHPNSGHVCGRCRLTLVNAQPISHPSKSWTSFASCNSLHIPDTPLLRGQHDQTKTGIGQSNSRDYLSPSEGEGQDDTGVENSREEVTRVINQGVNNEGFIHDEYRGAGVGTSEAQSENSSLSVLTRSWDTDRRLTIRVPPTNISNAKSTSNVTCAKGQQITNDNNMHHSS
ncbi:uncharacterized protein LOC142355365, partial [Convolutriloba macropyga]|uniref:uncharacterized protein LOC142355365 n=1 Tax=Convolutriloba macropyga TaxID=536237 RepID=UPI003F526FF0